MERSVKTRKSLFPVLAAMLMLTLALFAGCSDESGTSVSSGSKSGQSGAEAIDVDSAADLPSGFFTVLDYAAEKDGQLECELLLMALDATFNPDATGSDVTLGSQLESASNVQANVVDNGATMEVSFTMPADGLDPQSLTLDATIALANGTLLDMQGRSIGECEEATVLTFSNESRAVDAISEPANGTLELRFLGAYVMKVDIRWKECVGYSNMTGEPIWEDRAWEGNNRQFSSGARETIELKNAAYLHIVVRGTTGMIWNKWNTSFEGYVPVIDSRTMRIEGTTLKQRCEFNPPLD